MIESEWLNSPGPYVQYTYDPDLKLVALIRRFGFAFDDCCVEITNDIDPSFVTDCKMDALDCARYLKAKGYRYPRVLLDPPYSYRKSMELYKGNLNSRFKQLLDVIPDILELDGWVITFGYQSSVMSRKRGFAIREICLISHGGAQHDTIATVEERIKVTENEEEIIS